MDYADWSDDDLRKYYQYKIEKNRKSSTWSTVLGVYAVLGTLSMVGVIGSMFDRMDWVLKIVFLASAPAVAALAWSMLRERNDQQDIREIEHVLRNRGI